MTSRMSMMRMRFLPSIDRRVARVVLDAPHSANAMIGSCDAPSAWRWIWTGSGTFWRSAEHKVFARAADARHVTQPAFSRRIRALEEWIGTPLFERDPAGRGAHAGRHPFPAARGGPRAEPVPWPARRPGSPAGARPRILSVAATHALSFTFFPGLVPGADRMRGNSARSPSSPTAWRAARRSCSAGKADALLCHHHPAVPTRLDGPDFGSHAVGSDTLVPVCAPDDEGGPAWPLPGKEERPTRLLEYSAASGSGGSLPRFGRRLEGTEVFFTSHLAATLVTMAREGHGVAWLPLSTIGGDVDASRLVRAGPSLLDVPVEIRLFHPDAPSRKADFLLGRQ